MTVRSGLVRIGTEPALIGKSLASRGFMRQASRGEAVISDIYLAEHEVADAPTIAYLAPVRGTDGALVGIVALWVRATALWGMVKSSNGLVGPGSFAVLFDSHGIRIAYTYSQEIVFHPGGLNDGWKNFT